MTSNETREVVTTAMVNAAFNEAKTRQMTGLPNDFRAVLEVALSTAPALGRVDAVLRYYADTFCELDPHHESCGKLSKDECSGCLARSTLSQPPTSGSEAGAEIARLAKELDCDAEPATVFRAALNLAKQSVKPASSPADWPKDPETGLNDMSLGTLLRETRESAAETVLSGRGALFEEALIGHFGTSNTTTYTAREAGRQAAIVVRDLFAALDTEAR